MKIHPIKQISNHTAESQIRDSFWTGAPLHALAYDRCPDSDWTLISALPVSVQGRH